LIHLHQLAPPVFILGPIAGRFFANHEQAGLLTRGALQQGDGRALAVVRFLALDVGNVVGQALGVEGEGGVAVSNGNRSWVAQTRW